MNWINAKDRLPEIDKELLIFVEWQDDGWKSDMTFGHYNFIDREFYSFTTSYEVDLDLIKSIYWIYTDDIPKSEMK